MAVSIWEKSNDSPMDLRGTLFSGPKPWPILPGDENWIPINMDKS